MFWVPLQKDQTNTPRPHKTCHIRPWAAIRSFPSTSHSLVSLPSPISYSFTYCKVCNYDQFFDRHNNSRGNQNKMELADRRNCTVWCTYYWSVECTFAANIILSFSRIRGKLVCALISVLPLYHF